MHLSKVKLGICVHLETNQNVERQSIFISVYLKCSIKRLFGSQAAKEPELKTQVNHLEEALHLPSYSVDCSWADTKS